MSYTLINSDCFTWLNERAPNSVHGIVTDPPYGLIEFSEKERDILRNGQRGGIWRIPPKLNGVERDPLPRFTILTDNEKAKLRSYMLDWGTALLPALVPGAHIYVAGNPMLQHLIQSAMAEAGYEVRTVVMRLYVGLRGGDRPKLAEQEFSEVSVTPRGGYEPWMLFRKPISEKTVAANLRRWGTGGLRRLAGEKPFPDVIQSGRTPDVEAQLSSHPTVKPQHLLRILVRSALPLGQGIVLDTFAGSGSTLAAAEAIGYDSIGIELDQQYYLEALDTIPLLAKTYPGYVGDTLESPSIFLNAADRPKKRLRASPQGSLL